MTGSAWGQLKEDGTKSCRHGKYIQNHGEPKHALGVAWHCSVRSMIWWGMSCNVSYGYVAPCSYIAGCVSPNIYSNTCDFTNIGPNRDPAKL